MFEFIAITVLSENEEYGSFKGFETIFDFTVGLRNDSNNFLNYATKIQALFCPEQPICTDEGERNRSDVLSTLPEIMEIGTEAIRTEYVHQIVGTCCLPCSCDAKPCKEDGNCCLSKVFLDALSDNPDIDVHNLTGVLDLLNGVSEFEDDDANTVYSECIKASRMSYGDKDALEIAHDLDTPSYFMITECFGNNSIDFDVEKCQRPSGDEAEDMLPVISSNTGRIYWNSHCARCNNEESDILPWNSSVRFDFDITFFANDSKDYGSAVYPDMPDDLLGFISKTGDIVYSPPFPIADKMCLRKNTLYTCKSPSTKSTEVTWLKEVCERIYSPLIIENGFGRPYPYLNFFCYICRRQYTKPSEKRQCGSVEHHGKGTAGGLTAILDYKALFRSQTVLTTGSRQEKCNCDEIYDIYVVSVCTVSLFLISILKDYSSEQKNHRVST